MSITVSRLGGTVTLAIGERFDLASNPEFESAHEGNAGISEYVIDLNETTYMDSSALGMLLLLREACSPNVVVRIVNCSPAVRKTLHGAGLQKTFRIT